MKILEKFQDFLRFWRIFEEEMILKDIKIFYRIFGSKINKYQPLGCLRGCAGQKNTQKF
jgi:hypothetical protein